MFFNAKQRVNSDLSIIITRADGTVEDLGVVYRSFKNPFKQLAWDIRQGFKKVLSFFKG